MDLEGSIGQMVKVFHSAGTEMNRKRQGATYIL
jgi:hypothetical protein